MANDKSKKSHRSKNGKKSPEPARVPSKSAFFAVVGIGASAGGLEAVRELLNHLPEKTGMAYVFVQHLDPTHESELEEILSRATALPVMRVSDGVKVEPDHVYVIPANTSMSVSKGVLHLGAREKVRGMHFPIDHFFHSLADERGDQAIGVILSGTASDGTNGCSAIKAAGGITFAQDPDSAKYNSMPRSAIYAGVIDFVMSPKNIANELARISRHPYIASVLTPSEETPVTAARSDMEALFAMLRDATGVDFIHYKQSTLQRRIKRRMVLQRLSRMKDYLRFIRENPGELEELYRDILIHVTGFFRDEEAFEALKKQVLPKIVGGRKADDGPLRIWVPGCSTGEEVYSLAIVLLEFLWEEASKHPATSLPAKLVQIFATDISDTALDRARNGLYSDAAALSGVSQDRLKRFFIRLDGGYQISKSLREMCIFAKQNIAKDPPFSNIDLISCRNVLIYLGPLLQKRVVPTLHYALKPNGYLILGSSESLGQFSDHFILVDKKNKIYQKKRTGTRLITYFAGGDYAVLKVENSNVPKPAPSGFSVEEKEVERVLTNRFVPASIVVNDEMEIVQFRGKTGAYLEPASGHPTFSLSKMAREGLLVDLRDALTEAKKKGQPVRKEGIRINSNGSTREIEVEVIPIRRQGPHDRFYIVVFLEAGHAEAVAEGKRRGKGRERRRDPRETQGLMEEVKRLREQLQNLIEDHETTLEEFKSANEEVLSANEELQSTNEELETAKEELQSTNEELTTLNEELQNRNAELSIVNNDQLNLMANVNLPVVMVNNHLRVRRFTPPAEKLLNLLPGDVGRRIGEIRSNIETEDVEQLARETIDNATVQEKEVRQKDGPWFLMRARPYKTWDNKIDGAVISFQDIDSLKRSLDQSRVYADAVIESAREPILVLNQDLRVTVANPSYYKLFEVSPCETENRLLFDLGKRQWDIPVLRELLDKITRNNSRIDDYEVTRSFPHLGPRHMLLNARRIEPQEGLSLILLTIEDVTELRERSKSEMRLATLLEMAKETVIVRDLKGRISFWSHGAEQMYGWKKAEAIGKSLNDLLRTKYPKPFHEIQEELVRTGAWKGELVHTTRDGKTKRVATQWVVRREDNEEPEILEIINEAASHAVSD